MWFDPVRPACRPRKRPVLGERSAFSASWRPSLLMASLLAGASGAAWATPTPVTTDGVPEQVIPAVPEVGLGSFSMPTGTMSIMPNAGAGTGAGTGSTGTGSGGDASAPSLSGTAYDTMMGQSWGAAASGNAQAIGVNPTALAATCMLESGCSNTDTSGDIQGAFQMANSTYTSNLNAALQANPQLAGNIVPGLAGQDDPATQSIAAAQYLKTSAQQLQAAGIPNPTVLDVRGSYNFGAGNGVQLAQATNEQLMSTVLSSVSSSTLAQNGISPTMTVGQWRSSVSSKIGSAASQPVLIGA